MWWAWIIAAIGPLAKRALVAVGVGWVTYEALGVAVEAVRVEMVAQWGQMSGDVAGLLALGGVGQACGIVLGALAARGALMAGARLGKVVA